MASNKKIAFIICTNNKIQFDECKLYIDKLIVPDGYETELIPIYGAVSMTSGYNSAMAETDARYKIYMHQDVYIINRYFLLNIIDIFNKDDSIGMIGMIGSTHIPPSAVMWLGDRVGNFRSWPGGNFEHERITEDSIIHEVESIDGFMMVTRVDMPWRSDIFDGWDFYDVSQSFEIRKEGYKIVVPEQLSTWCVHDDGVIMSLWNYDRYRRKLIDSYSNMIPVAGEQDPEYKAYLEIIRTYSDNTADMQGMLGSIIEKISDIIGSHEAGAFSTICDALKDKDNLLRASSRLTQIQLLGSCVHQEYAMKLPTFIDDVSNIDEFEDKLLVLKLMLRRIELSSMVTSEEEVMEAYAFICDSYISPFSILTMLYSHISIYVERENIMLSIASNMIEKGDVSGAFVALSLIPDPSVETRQLLDEFRKT